MTPHAQRLFNAIRTNDLETVRTAIAKKQAIFSHEDRHRNGVLHWAVDTPGGTDMLALLLSASNRSVDSLNRFNNAYQTPLIVAAQANALDKARLLLDAGADPNAQYEFMGRRSAALHTATSAAMVNLLVDAGAHREARDSSMLTPLLNMAQRGQVEAFEALLAAGANRAATVTTSYNCLSKLPDLTGYNALHLTVMTSFPGSTTMVARLLELGFSPLAMTPSGETAVDLARIPATQNRPTINLGFLESWLLRQEATPEEGFERRSNERRPRL